MSFFSKILQKIISVKVQLLWVAAIILLIYFIYFSIQNAGQPSHGFASYYTASKLLIESENVADFYNDYWFSLKVEKYVPGVYEIYLINMPVTTFVFLPFANFEYKTAKKIWTIFNILLLTVALRFIQSRLKPKGAWFPLTFIIFLSFQPLYANIAFGQVYILIFFLLAVAWFAYESGNELLLGISIGLVFILKTAGIFLLVLLVVKKKWKSLVWFVACVLFIFAVTLPIVGLESWTVYLNKLLEYTSSPTLSVTAYQTMHSFFHHFFVFDMQWNPKPLIDLPLVGKSMMILFTIIILIVTIIAAIKSKKADLVFGIFIIEGIILSPSSIDYHYVLMLIPIFILFHWLIKNPSVLLWSLFAISYLLIAVSLPYISPKITGGIWAVFAYPKLYGALGLLALSIRASYIMKLKES